jgi:hypothetical protein
MKRKIHAGIRDSGYSRIIRVSDFAKKDFITGCVGIIFGLISNLLFSYFPNVYGFLSSFLSQFWINLIGIIVIGIVGSLLYLLRERKRIWYGAIEVSFSLAYGWYAINKVASVGYVETISVIASIYLVVRGIDNVMEGRKKQLAEALIKDTKQLQPETKNELPAAI